MNFKTFKKGVVLGVAVLAICALSVPAAFAQVPGGSLNPNAIPKYQDPLIVPPAMPTSGTDQYDIAVRQFSQQILPFTGCAPPAVCAGAAFPETTVWSYGATDTTGTPNMATFNYPAFTIEAQRGTQITVRWRNQLVDGSNNYLPYLIPNVVDQTLHWANPAKATNCVNGFPGTDCRTLDPLPYTGPVPMIVHVHGADTTDDSDGYPEAWYLPNAANVDCTNDYDCRGTYARGPFSANYLPGLARFRYPNIQPSTTLWYHDHTLGMTRLNVYAGPAGFYLIRDPGGTDGETGLAANDAQNPPQPQLLPGPAPVVGDSAFPAVGTIREIPIAIQDRSFNNDGTLFYPSERAFFEGVASNAALGIPFIGDPTGIGRPSDISPIWNPEAFFNTMVVNGRTWPFLEVAPVRYRLRLLNGCNSRFLNLALFRVANSGNIRRGNELPFFQIGAEQSTLPQVVMVKTGYATPLTPGNAIPTRNRDMLRAASRDQALLLGPAERADVIVDFSGLAPGTRIRMINTAPDAPFGGFPDVAADPGTTGQVMEFVVTNTAGPGPMGTWPDPSTPVQFLQLNPVDGVDAYPATPLDAQLNVSLNEAASAAVCVNIAPNGTITYIPGVFVSDPLDEVQFAIDCAAAGGEPFAPKEALLGTLAVIPGVGLAGDPLLWADPVTENPGVGDTQQWNMYNFTVDAHPIHIHLVKFKVTGRSLLAGGAGTIPGTGVQPWEIGWKDTVIAYPGEITNVAATFDREGLYVWHCHIVEHEDNEMMRPYCVGNPAYCPD